VLKSSENFLKTLKKVNKKAVLSQGEPRDGSKNFDTYRILQKVDNGKFTYIR